MQRQLSCQPVTFSVGSDRHEAALSALHRHGWTDAGAGTSSTAATAAGDSAAAASDSAAAASDFAAAAGDSAAAAGDSAAAPLGASVGGGSAGGLRESRARGTAPVAAVVMDDGFQVGGQGKKFELNSSWK